MAGLPLYLIAIPLRRSLAAAMGNLKRGARLLHAAALKSNGREKRTVKAPSPNIQAPKKLQSSNFKRQGCPWLGYWSLVLFWMLDLGIWCFLKLLSEKL